MLCILAAMGILVAGPRVGYCQEPDGAVEAQAAVSQPDGAPAFLARYCSRCHFGERPRAGLALDALGEASSVVTERPAWERVLRVLREHEMPPPRSPQPPAVERTGMVAWIEAELEKLDCGAGVDPGRVTLRRLNRAEYQNTVRDLLEVEFQASEAFPADEVGYGFDNIGDVLSLPVLLMEKYLDAAEEVLDLALSRPEARLFRPQRFQAEDCESTAESFVITGSLSINKEGEVFADCAFPVEGDYALRTRAYGQQAGPEPARLAIRIAGTEVRRFDVTAEEDAPGLYEAVARVPAGTSRFSVAFLNNYFNPDDPDPAKRGDRNLIVDWFEAQLQKPLHAPALPESYRRLFDCLPLAGKAREACARELLAGFASRAFRRPVREEELERLLGLLDAALGHGDAFEEAVRLPLKAVLVSPHFLFRVESDSGLPVEGAGSELPVELLGDYALASRLSYFIWSSLPDDELFALAAAGKLQDDAVLEAQVRRMLADPRSAALAESFASQWLQTRLLHGISPDPELFPGFDEELRDGMQAETTRFFEAVMREDRSLLEFLDADFTYVNERLARHYGIPGVAGPELRRVSLEGLPRGGVLTHASILTLTSNPTRTSPVKRGKWVLEQILGAPPPPPPPDVPELEEEKEAILSGSLRQRMEKHRSDPNCAVCHTQMDAIGFAFENFDAVGAWREFDGPFLIDPSGELPGGRQFEGPAGLKSILKSRKEDFGRTLARKMLTYALGRGLEYYDKCAVDEIVDFLAESEYKFSSLVTAVVKTKPFRMRRGGATRQ
jgi:hypothetical protein